MTTAQVTFTETELLADHVIAEPLIANGVRCHGGFDEDGNYVSPRTLNRWPAIHANDPDWSSGARLDRYEIQDGAGKPNGYDFSCPVTLWLRAGGAVKSKTVHYTIGTGAALVVVRDPGA